LGAVLTLALGTMCPDGKSECNPGNCVGGVAECCSDGSVCPGHTCAKCECPSCGGDGHDKNYDAASQLTVCPGDGPKDYCQPDLCVGGTAMCCPKTGKVCPASTCATCDCFDCETTDADGEAKTIPHSSAGWNDASRLSTCHGSAATCDPDNCMNGIAECCADGSVCPGHVCEKCQCSGNCTSTPRTHALAPKPVPKSSGGGGGGGSSGPNPLPAAQLKTTDQCFMCDYCSSTRCMHCTFCDGKKIAAKFNVTYVPMLASARGGSSLPAPFGRGFDIIIACAALSTAVALSVWAVKARRSRKASDDLDAALLANAHAGGVAETEAEAITRRLIEA